MKIYSITQAAIFSFFLLFSHSSSHAFDVASVVTSSFSDIDKMTRSLVATDPVGTLYVTDIDNTFFRTASDLGSEHWFLWQKGLLEAGHQALPLVTNSLEGLFAIQGWIYQAGTMEAVANQGPALLRDITRSGAHAIALTSRVLEAGDYSAREFRDHQAPLSSSEDLGLKTFLQTTLPYHLDNLESSGLNAQLVQELKLGAPKEVVFEGGVFLTQGQHKGAMLISLLSQLPRRYRNIVFVDDRAHHISGMRQAFRHRAENLYTFQYTRSLNWVEAFNKGDKAQVQTVWCELARGLRLAGVGAERGVSFRTCEGHK